LASVALACATKIFQVSSVGALFWLLFWACKKVTKAFNQDKQTQGRNYK